VAHNFLLTTSDGRSFPIGPNGLSIGRSSANEVVIADPSISRLHARIFFANGSFWLRDENSKRGTYLNGYLLKGQSRVYPGDTIQIGSTTIQITSAAFESTGRPFNKTRRNRLVFIGMAAVAILIVLLAMGSGGDGRKKKPLPSLPSMDLITWTPQNLELTVLQGTTQELPLTFISGSDLDRISYDVSPEIASLVVVQGETLTQTQAYLTNVLPAIIQAAKTTAPGSYRGNIQIKRNTTTLNNNVEVIINVIAPSGSIVPVGVAEPSEDRIVMDPDGQWLVGDEIVVGLGFDTPNPSQRIIQIAGDSGGAILGSIPETLSYQLIYNVNDLNGLESIRKLLETQPDVEFASHAYMTDASSNTVPNDSEYEKKWDEKSPSGNNWHLENVKALSAWDLNTGSSSVQIGIIDNGVDRNHDDLNDNIASDDTSKQASKKHGTHVSGIICAEGNNNKGVSGLMWDCSLRFYSYSIKSKVAAIAAQEEMVKAVNDSSRIVNISLQWIDNNKCVTSGSTATLSKVKENNAILGRSILFALRQNKEVLWIFAAGNECRDAKYASPASLTEVFPLNTISVASIDPSGVRSKFSNFGESVSVAAPGKDILSTLPRFCIFSKCFDRYGEMSGTSMAAPIVSGIAGLVLSQHPDFSSAQIKQCILAGALKGGNAVGDNNHSIVHKFKSVSAFDAIQCQGEVPLPDQVDLVFALDLTGSMGDELNQVKDNIRKIIDDLRTKASPSTDFTFAVVSYEDYPQSYDSSSCGSRYSDQYGEAGSKSNGDVPFRIDRQLTNDITAVYGAIYSLELGDGKDEPEPYGRVFWSITREIPFRSSALKLVVNFGDSMPHEKDLNEGIIDPPIQPFDTSIDPGPNNQIDCGGDDIDFQDTALSEMAKMGVKLLHIDSSGETKLTPYWQYWTSQTGGVYTAINPDGTIPGGVDLAQLIINILRLTPH
jgi:subtilisin family serine protease